MFRIDSMYNRAPEFTVSPENVGVGVLSGPALSCTRTAVYEFEKRYRHDIV